MKIKMKDVAKAAGVNQSTVSRAFKGSHKISASKRKEILRIAEELGYRPDPMVSALMAQRRGKQATQLGTLALVVLWPQNEKSWLELDYYARYREGLWERAEASGYHIEAFRCDGSPKQVEALLRVLRARGIRGIIFSHAHESFKELPFSLEGFVGVYMGPGIRNPPLTRIVTADAENLRMAWEHIRSRGHRRILFLTWSVLTSKNLGTWLGAFRQCQMELPERDRIEPVELRIMDLDEAMGSLKTNQPDAVLSENSGLMIELSKLRPDVAFFALERYKRDSISGVSDRRKAQGIAVADAVIAQLNRGEYGLPNVAKRLLIEGEWVD